MKERLLFMYAQHIILDFEMNPTEKKNGTVAQLLK